MIKIKIQSLLLFTILSSCCFSCNRSCLCTIRWKEYCDNGEYEIHEEHFIEYLEDYHYMDNFHVKSCSFVTQHLNEIHQDDFNQGVISIDCTAD